MYAVLRTTGWYGGDSAWVISGANKVNTGNESDRSVNEIQGAIRSERDLPNGIAEEKMIMVMIKEMIGSQ